MPLTPGMSIGPNLRLLRVLAHGGMGNVWAAEHSALGTQVAVKFMAEEMVSDSSAVLRFSREAAAAARIKSPHVVQILDHGVWEERFPYIVMELLDGSTLGAILRERKVLELNATVAIVTQICRVLEKAHEIGIVHRDIKPDNLFLTDSGGQLFVKVLDFGVAKQLESGGAAVTATGVALGTPSYMSPEQILGARHLSFASDLWAVGVVTYACLTGKLPFRSDSYGGLSIAISRGIFAPPSSVRHGLPLELDSWFARALDLDPQKRFASAREMAFDYQVAAGFSPDATISVRALRAKTAPPAEAPNAHAATVAADPVLPRAVTAFSMAPRAAATVATPSRGKVPPPLPVPAPAARPKVPPLPVNAGPSVAYAREPIAGSNPAQAREAMSAPILPPAPPSHPPPAPARSAPPRQRLTESTVAVAAPLVWPDWPRAESSSPPVAKPVLMGELGGSLPPFHTEVHPETEKRARWWLVWAACAAIALGAGATTLRGTYRPSAATTDTRIDTRAIAERDVPVAPPAPPPVTPRIATPSSSPGSLEIGPLVNIVRADELPAAPPERVKAMPPASKPEPRVKAKVERPDLRPRCPRTGALLPLPTPSDSTPSEPVSPSRDRAERDLLAP